MKIEWNQHQSSYWVIKYHQPLVKMVYFRTYPWFDIYSFRLIVIVSLVFFSFSQNNCHFTIPMQHLFYFFHYYTLIYWISSNLTTLLTTINKDVLVIVTNFTIKIITINHFLNNCAYKCTICFSLLRVFLMRSKNKFIV